MKKSAITVLLGDPTMADPAKPNAQFTAEDLDAVAYLHDALAELAAFTFSYLNDHRQLLRRLIDAPPAFVLNFCDNGYQNHAGFEPHLTALLDMLGIPYSGSGPTALTLCYDKALVRALAASVGVPVPIETYGTAANISLTAVDYPAFIKPNSADGSVGIGERSLVHDATEARAYLSELDRQLPGQPLLVQEFLPGAEYSLALIGNPEHGFRALPVLEVDYSRLDPTRPRLLDFGSKSDPSSPYWTDVRYRPAELDVATRQRLVDAAGRLFTRLGLRDYGRFDFRVDGQGVIKLLEVNPNPAWCWDGKLNLMAGFAGMSYSGLLETIIETARERYRLG